MNSNINIKVEQIELWRDIGIVKGIDFTGYYQVSNKGRVRSLDRTVFGYGGRSWPHKGKVMSVSINIYGYAQIGLSINGAGTTHQVQRLVAIMFIPNPLNKSQVNHIDSNRANNDVSNLEWVTPKENMRHAMEFGGKNSVSKKDIMDVIYLYKNGKSTRQIAKIYNISAPTIGAVLKNNNVILRSLSESHAVKFKYDEKKIINLYQSNMTLRMVAESIGASTNTVIKVLKVNNIKIRSRREAALIRCNY